MKTVVKLNGIKIINDLRLGLAGGKLSNNLLMESGLKNSTPLWRWMVLSVNREHFIARNLPFSGFLEGRHSRHSVMLGLVVSVRDDLGGHWPHHLSFYYHYSPSLDCLSHVFLSVLLNTTVRVSLACPEIQHLHTSCRRSIEIPPVIFRAISIQTLNGVGEVLCWNADKTSLIHIEHCH